MGTYILDSKIPRKTKSDDLVIKRREQIIRAAIKLFSEKGFAQTTLRELAHESGLSHGNIYDYVGSKNDILFLIHEFIHSVATARINQSIKSVHDPMEKLFRIIRTEIATMYELSDAVLLMYRDSRALEKHFLKKMLSRERERIQIFENVLEECMSQNLLQTLNARALANLIKTMSETLVLKRWDMKKMVNREEMERIILAMVFNGLLKKPQKEQLSPVADNLRGKSILIINYTDCGRRLHPFLLAKGARLALYVNSDLQGEQAKLIAQQEKGKNCKVYLSRDVGPMSSKLLKYIIHDFGPVEIIIHYFGIGTGIAVPAGQSNMPGFENNFDYAQELANYIQKNAGKMSLEKILYLAPCAEERNVNAIWYEATKAALTVLTKSVADNLAATGINVNCVVPGLPEKTGLMKEEEGAKRTKNAARASNGVIVEENDFSEIVYFLISRKSQYLNGEVITVSGRSI